MLTAERDENKNKTTRESIGIELENKVAGKRMKAEKLTD